MPDQAHKTQITVGVWTGSNDSVSHEVSILSIVGLNIMQKEEQGCGRLQNQAVVGNVGQIVDVSGQMVLAKESWKIVMQIRTPWVMKN